MQQSHGEPRDSDAAARHPYQDGPRIPVPPRKTLPHEAPSFVDPAKEIYFVTVCCRKRGVNQLAVPDVAEPLIDTIKHRNERGDWYAHLAMIMPDHIHLHVSFHATLASRTPFPSGRNGPQKRCGSAGSATSSSIDCVPAKATANKRITSW